MIKEENVIEHPKSLESRVTAVEVNIFHIGQTLSRIENKLDKLDDKMEKGFSEIRKEMKSDFRLLLSAIVGVLGVMAHGFHWF